MPFKRIFNAEKLLKSQSIDSQHFSKIAHNRVISDQATPWLKKIDSQTTICKIFYPIKSMRVMCLALAAPARHHAMFRKTPFCYQISRHTKGWTPMVRNPAQYVLCTKSCFSKWRFNQATFSSFFITENMKTKLARHNATSTPQTAVRGTLFQR